MRYVAMLAQVCRCLSICWTCTIKY